MMANKTIAILTNIRDDWGGSEELWARSIPYLQELGYRTAVLKAGINYRHPEFIRLAANGTDLIDFKAESSLAEKTTSFIFKKTGRFLGKDVATGFTAEMPVLRFKKQLHRLKPAFAIISQGINFDGLGYAHACLELKIPYVLIAQKAVDFYWPAPSDRPLMARIYQQAAASFFVSQHNLTLTEEQLGVRFKNSSVVFNPVKIKHVIPYPSTHEGFRLACVGRLFILDKGQDILIRVLSRQKWQKRPLTVSFIGSGIDEQGLRDMAALLRVKNIEFAGPQDDMEKVWAQFHGYVGPSRSEGLPLSMVEAMAAGRPVIVSRAGGNTELMEEPVTGFSGEANETAFDEALERAWQRRDQWEQIGIAAAESIRRKVPQLPEKEFVNTIKELI
jgi:glycosyltransferase involved in cell wall biosynthesis